MKKFDKYIKTMICLQESIYLDSKTFAVKAEKEKDQKTKQRYEFIAKMLLDAGETLDNSFDKINTVSALTNILNIKKLNSIKI